MLTVDEELLTPAGMAAGYAALTAKYPWYFHIKPVRKFELIKTGGLQPRTQGCQTNQIVAAAIGKSVNNVDEMVFLRPIGTTNSTPRRGERMFSMAIGKAVLPTTITVDWTFGGTFGLAGIIKRDASALTNDMIFCEVVRRRGLVAVYETIHGTRCMYGPKANHRMIRPRGPSWSIRT